MCLVRFAQAVGQVAFGILYGIAESKQSRKNREAVRRYEANRRYQRCQHPER